ncbi:nucleoporin Nup35 [Episyrphus balteatus]|uniref:nucleoporin Nup35 n=1 Tax=Episyrphus balteatus TaxID=286459 RepID=UPI0024860DFF|nr:nucleoporin Nup35 [Episyrphus balteatus]
MEPMTLGSPSGSPATGTSPYLPSFLMGEPNAPSTPRNNTLSPNKGRNISFAPSPGATSPQDFNRSALGQKTLFGYQQSSSGANNYPGTPIQNHNASMSGPPTQGLFDSLHSDRNSVQTPTRSNQMALQHQSMQYGTPLSQQYQMNQSVNDSYLSAGGKNNSFNPSRLTSPPISNPMSFDYRNNNANLLQCPPLPRYTEFWITVYGFPQSATSMILSHFSQCGTIIDKVFPSQNGNWVHLKFSSRLECDKALNYNEKILGSNIMIGVTQCKDKNIIDKENVCENNQVTSKIRPLSQVAYRSAQSESAVVASPNAPQKSSGLVNKAMDLFFGW